VLSTFLVKSFIDWIWEPIYVNISVFDYNIFKIYCDFYIYLTVIIIADQIRNARLHPNLMVSNLSLQLFNIYTSFLKICLNGS